MSHLETMSRIDLYHFVSRRKCINIRRLIENSSSPAKPQSGLFFQRRQPEAVAVQFCSENSSWSHNSIILFNKTVYDVIWVNACQCGIAWMQRYRMYNPNLQNITHHDIIALPAFLRTTWRMTILWWPLAMALAPLLRSAAVLDLCEVGWAGAGRQLCE